MSVASTTNYHELWKEAILNALDEKDPLNTKQGASMYADSVLWKPDDATIDNREAFDLFFRAKAKMDKQGKTTKETKVTLVNYKSSWGAIPSWCKVVWEGDNAVNLVSDEEDEYDVGASPLDGEGMPKKGSDGIYNLLSDDSDDEEWVDPLAVDDSDDESDDEGSSSQNWSPKTPALNGGHSDQWYKKQLVEHNKDIPNSTFKTKQEKEKKDFDALFDTSDEESDDEDELPAAYSAEPFVPAAMPVPVAPVVVQAAVVVPVVAQVAVVAPEPRRSTRKRKERDFLTYKSMDTKVHKKN